MPDAEVVIVYKNWKGEVGTRLIRPKQLWFGTNAWHHEPQWLLDAVDLDKGAERTFAMAGVTSWVAPSG